jgi:hypothetical protein
MKPRVVMLCAGASPPDRLAERGHRRERLRSSILRGLALASIGSASSYAAPAHALDKQGSAHGGAVGHDQAGVHVSGALSFGLALHNRSYAARPDNTGLALFRYAAHLDLDLLGPRLSIPFDVNLFTDNERRGARKLAPSELDLISGLTSTHSLGRLGALEVGTRLEHDGTLSHAAHPGGQGGAPPSCGHGALCAQRYVDARARLLYALGGAAPRLKSALREGDISGFFTLGFFAWNPSYAARPDNSGKALLRYGAHSELSVFGDRLSAALDGAVFTDRHGNAVRPSELDLTPEIIGHLDPFEVHLAYERDLPLDRRGLTQSFVYLLGVWSFDTARAPASAPAPADPAPPSPPAP